MARPSLNSPATEDAAATGGVSALERGISVLRCFTADVRELFTPPRRARRSARPRTVHELVAQITAATSELPHDRAQQVTSAVLQTLRSLVPEEQIDVAAVLPPELRDLWQQGGVGEP